VKRWWHDYRWLAIGGAWLGALYLGYVGFARHAAATGEAASAWDLLYLTLQLVSMNSGAVPGPIGWQLEVARFLIPALAALTAVQALAILFREQVDLLRLRFMRGHVVICGLGRRGFLLVDGFRRLGHTVVVIEQDEGNDLVEQCRARGAVVLIGDATDGQLLRKVAVPKARHLIAVCGDDGANAEVAVRASGLVRDRKRGSLTCLIHIVDPQLCELLKEREIGMETGSTFRLELFNVFERGARLLLQELPGLGEAQTGPQHLLVVGLGRMGESLVVQAARAWRDERPVADRRLRITVVDREAHWKCESLNVRYPYLVQACELVACEMDVRSPQFQRAEFLHASPDQCAVDAACVCLDDDSLGLCAGLTLLGQMRQHGIPVVVRMTEDTGLAALLPDEPGEGGAFEHLHAFGLLDRTCTPDLVLGGTHETLARAMHEEYVRHREKLGESRLTNPILVPWDRLPERVRESNRRQADRIGMKLRAVGCGIAPLTDWDATSFEFLPEEVESAARLEHEAWYAELERDGWVYAPGPKDPDRKTHPDLVPWEELPESEKEKNRIAVRGLPRFLARAGFQVRRLR
jgi:voltage-gated potassium channel Kch